MEGWEDWRMYVGYMQIVHHLTQGTWTFIDFGIYKGPGTSPLWILRDDSRLLGWVKGAGMREEIEEIRKSGEN